MEDAMPAEATALMLDAKIVRNGVPAPPNPPHIERRGDARIRGGPMTHNTQKGRESTL